LESIVKVTLRKFRYRYLPYENRFLAIEASAIGKIRAHSDDKVVVELPGTSRKALDNRLRKLTYFSHYAIKEQKPRPTEQCLLETAANGQQVLTRRQSTRYSTHGIHEYKGKFNPQIARHLMNRSLVNPGAVILDPFCGSGTVLLEAMHHGCHSIGLDSNPLAPLVANAKVFLLRARPGKIDDFEAIVTSIIEQLRELSTSRRKEVMAFELGLHGTSLEYLKSWFPPRALEKLLEFRLQTRRQLSGNWRQIADVLLSNIVREVSFQDPADLRIRRRKTRPPTSSIERMLTSSLASTLKRAKAVPYFLRGANLCVARAHCADSRDSTEFLLKSLSKIQRRKFDLLITSPPYANALPYVDTSRLSLVLLGLSIPQDLKRHEALQVGNREISHGQRESLEKTLENDMVNLPDEISGFVLRLLRLGQTHEIGFRKRNMPVLLARYFNSIREVLLETTGLLRPNAFSFWVVGKNRTEVNNRWIDIDTPRWIASIGSSLGLLVRLEQLNTYQRFGLHHSNSIRDEYLVVFKNSS
jgi:site-specific DNA-methyltransferase (cytosine-N4-specific)